MATAVVPFEAYVAGDLPDVSVVSGAATTHRVVVTSPLTDPSVGSAGHALGFLLRLVDELSRFWDRTGMRIVLRGRIPMTPAEQRSLERRRITATATGWAMVVALIVVAWVGQPWSPIAAVIAIAMIATSLVAGARVRAEWPRATIDEQHEWVTLRRVGDGFAMAANVRFDVHGR